jgi:hypothetical protein
MTDKELSATIAEFLKTQSSKDSTPALWLGPIPSLKDMRRLQALCLGP